MICSYQFCDSVNKTIVYNSGYCNACYQRLKYNGFVERRARGQSFHPLYKSWNEKKNQNLLSDDWLDFFDFLDDVVEKPEGDFKLSRLDNTQPYGPKNFKWLKLITRLPNETEAEYSSRKWQLSKNDHRNYQLKKEFGINFDAYNEMLQAQNRVCKICQQPETTRHPKNNTLKSLAVDHCHTTGKIRGLLCQRCNRTLGKLNDSVELLDKMKAYLNDNS